MATLNTNSQPAPFGSNAAVADPDLAHATFLGASVANFTVNADWSGQSGKCTIKLVEDDLLDQKFAIPTIGSPQFFKLLNTSGGTVFQFNGIVESVSRDISPDSGKIYTVVLASPSKILSNVMIVTNKYAGYGYGQEGIARFMSIDGYYDIDGAPSGYVYTGGGGGTPSSIANSGFHNSGDYQFGTNNQAVKWTNYYNILNVFGGFENESAGLKNMTFKGFGAADSNDEGMRFDRVCFALHELINDTNSVENQKYYGSNIVHGTDTYNICGPTFNIYYYGLDVYGLLSQLQNVLPYDFRISGGNITLLDFIGQIATAANMEYYIELTETAYTSGINTDYSNTGYGPYDGTTNIFTLDKSWTNSVLGGVISVRFSAKNSTANCTHPFSSIAYDLIGLEKPNFGDYGTTGSGIHPGLQPTGYSGPMDADYTLGGTRSSKPYGGKFPYTTSGDYDNGDSLSYHLNRLTSASVSLQATDGVATKMVVGDYQSRMVTIPRNYVYHYWGDIAFMDLAANICNSGALSSEQALAVATRAIPVITQQLNANDIDEFILIDTQDIFSSGSVPGAVVHGVYLASLLEIRLAMTDAQTWEDYLRMFKPVKLKNIHLHLGVNFDTALSTSKDWINQKDPNNLTEGYVTAESKAAVGSPLHLTPTNINRISTNKKFDVDASGCATSGSGVASGNHLIYHDDTKAWEAFYKIHSKIKNVGDTHYGKSWYVPMPFMTTKLTSNSENLIGNFVRSWDISDSAYIEPLAFTKLEAPQSSTFIQDGKVKPYVNWEHSFYADETNGRSGVYEDIFTSQITTFKDNQKFAFDFSEFDQKSIVFSNICATGDNTQAVTLVHTSPENVDASYSFVPHNYFSVYNRNLIPFNTIDSGVFNYVLPSGTGGIPNQPLATLYGAVFGNGIATPITEDLSEKLKARAVLESGVIALKGLTFRDNGTDSYPFIRVTTNRVYHPFTIPKDRESTNVPQLASAMSMLIPGISGCKTNKMFDSINSMSFFEWQAFPATIPPKTIGIPQRSNRYVYGPWISDYTIKWAGKVEYEQNDNLRPENYLLPVFGGFPTIPSYGPTIGSTISGFQGMNLAGQAYANAIDNFDLFAAEQGTITIPGAPLVMNIADALLGGPLVTDISVNIKPDGLETTYNFRTYAPRAGRTNRDFIKRLEKVSNTIKNMGRK